MVKQPSRTGESFINATDVSPTGGSETLVGNALKGVREEVVLATKVRLPMGENFQPGLQRRPCLSCAKWK